MKKNILMVFAAIIMLQISNVSFGQAPPLGTTASFALFTAVGAFSNDGATIVTGDIGTNVGAFSGFPPGIVIGQIHVADGVSPQAATDADDAYSYLSGLNCDEVIGTTLGNGQVLTQNIYCLGAASTLNGDLVLDGGGDPDALFIFKIDGALSTTTFSNVILINLASSCNVWWQINGAVELGENSVFRGTMLVNGAISLLESATLFGRGISREGAISLHNNIVNMSMLPIAAEIASSGAITFCAGDSTVLSGNIDGTWSNGSTSASITVFASGDYYVTNTTGCGSDTSNHISVTVTSCGGECAAPVIISVDSVCGNDASMCWTPIPGATGYLVQWNQLPDTTWIYTTVAAPANCYQFTNHFGDVNELQVATICENGDTSAFSPLVTWTNYLVCAAPESLVSSNVTATSADLSWSANPDANKYRVLYKNGGNKTILDVTGTAVSVSSLPSSTKIKWKVKSRCKTCGASNWGSYSAFQSFTTEALKQVVPGQQSAASMVIFPNPAEVNFTINFNEGFSSQQPYTLAVQDMAGRILLMNEGTLTDGSLIQDISLADALSNGTYFVVITTNGKQFREQLIVIGK